MTATVLFESLSLDGCIARPRSGEIEPIARAFAEGLTT
jgi:hypothetical protein